MDVYERGSAWTEHHRSIWTKDKVEELRELWNTGLPTRDIADHLGGEFTRSAVIGKAHRLELERHKAPVASRPKRIKPVSSSGVETPSSRLMPVLPPPQPLPREPPAPPRMRALQLVELAEHHCRWPCGDPHQAGFYFCAADRRPGCVYCSHHMGMAFARSRNGG